MITRLTLAHPSHKRLRAWLERSAPATGDDRDARNDDAVTAHVEHCERCADRLVALSFEDSDDEALGGEIAMALREALAPPPGINDRVLRAIDERQRADREVNLLLGLFSIATDAVDLLLPDRDRTHTNMRDEDRREREEDQ